MIIILLCLYAVALLVGVMLGKCESDNRSTHGPIDRTDETPPDKKDNTAWPDNVTDPQSPRS